MTTTIRVKNDGAETYIRKGPGLNYPWFDTATPADELSVIHRGAHWTEIRKPGARRSGFIGNNRIAEDVPLPQPRPATSEAKRPAPGAASEPAEEPNAAPPPGDDRPVYSPLDPPHEPLPRVPLIPTWVKVLIIGLGFLALLIWLDARQAMINR